VQQHDVAELAGLVQVAQHAHDRRDAATGADEQQLVGQPLGEQELALDATQGHDRARAPALNEVRRDLALVDVLDGDADQPVLARRVRGE